MRKLGRQVEGEWALVAGERRDGYLARRRTPGDTGPLGTEKPDSEQGAVLWRIPALLRT